MSEPGARANIHDLCKQSRLSANNDNNDANTEAVLAIPKLKNIKEIDAREKSFIDSLISEQYPRSHTFVVRDIWKVDASTSKVRYLNHVKTAPLIVPTPEVKSLPILTICCGDISLDKVLKIDSTREVLLFHGTSCRNISSIVRLGFDMQCAQSGTYGKGFYFAESVQQSDSYCDRNRDCMLTVLLCRVCLGKMCRYNESSHGSYDSLVSGYGKGYREFIVKEEHKCFPEYVIVYDRVIHDDLPPREEPTAPPFSLSL